MPKVALIRSAFLSSLREEGQEELALILGEKSNFYIEKACEEAGFTLADPEEVLEDDAGILISEGAVGLTASLLKNFQSSSFSLLQNLKEEPAALRVAALYNADLADAFEEMAKEVEGRVLTASFSFLGSIEELSHSQATAAMAINRFWTEQGVRIDQPETVWIGPQVTIGRGSWIEPNVKILGQSQLGRGVRVGSASEIYDSTIGDRVRIRSSVIESSLMEEDSNIGPCSHLRPHSKVGKRVHIGNFVELKKASMGEGSKAGHLAYIGDAQLGRDVNVSCGVIFCNYDGKKKHTTVVGDKAFIGSNANLVAPVEVEEEGFIAAGSTVTRRVEKGELLVERAEEKHIPGYVEKRKKKGSL